VNNIFGKYDDDSLVFKEVGKISLEPAAGNDVLERSLGLMVQPLEAAGTGEAGKGEAEEGGEGEGAALLAEKSAAGGGMSLLY
jgi:hypothetical protein